MCHPEKNSFEIIKERLKISSNYLLSRSVQDGHSVQIRVQNHKSSRTGSNNGLKTFLAC